MGCELPPGDKSRELLDTEVHGFHVQIDGDFSLNTRRKAPADEYDFRVAVRVTHNSTKHRVRFESPLSAQLQSKDTDQLANLWEPIGLEHCQHPSGSPIVYRVTGVSPQLDKAPQHWRALMVYPSAVALVIIKEAAEDCQAAMAMVPQPSDFLREALEKDATHLVATATEDSVFPRSINAGYIISAQEGVNLPAALDFLFRHEGTLDRPPNHLGLLPDAIAKGKGGDPDLEARFLEKLLPEAEPSSIPRFHVEYPSGRFGWVLSLLKRVGDRERQLATANTIVKRCKKRRYVRQCHPFRLRSAAWLARQAKDTELCDGVLGLLPDVAPPDDADCLGDESASRLCQIDRGHRLYMPLHLAGSCGSPSSVRRAALAVLRAEPWSVDFRAFDCEKSTYDQCPGIYDLAASILAAHCNDEVVEAAREWLTAENLGLSSVAPCLLAKCGGTAELDRAVTASKLTEQQRGDALKCAFDNHWRQVADGGV